MNVSKQRRLVGWTQHDLARETGINVTRIAFAETNRTKLTEEEISCIKSAIRERSKKITSELSAA